MTWDLAYCSRSGPPSQPWLEPDVNDHLTALAAEGVQAVVLSPIGFVSDHMEVAFDLDTEALETATELGLVAVRADTVGTREPFVRGLVDLVLERAALARDADANGAHPVTADLAADAAARPVAEATAGELPPYRSVCRPGCCQMRAESPTGIPAACSTDPWS